MEIVRHIPLVIHLLGFAALFGGLLVQIKAPDKVSWPHVSGTIPTS